MIAVLTHWVLTMCHFPCGNKSFALSTPHFTWGNKHKNSQVFNSYKQLMYYFTRNDFIFSINLFISIETYPIRISFGDSTENPERNKSNTEKAPIYICLPFELCLHARCSIWSPQFTISQNKRFLMIFFIMWISMKTKSQMSLPQVSRYCQPSLSEKEREKKQNNQNDDYDFLVIWLKIYLATESILLV